MHVNTLVWLKSDQIGFLIVELKHPDYSIDSRITPACIRSSGSDRILRSAQAQDFSPGLWAGSRRTAAASFLRNHRKKERHCAPSLCNYHVHHIRSVQRCMPRQLVTSEVKRSRGQPEVALSQLVEMGTAVTSGQQSNFFTSMYTRIITVVWLSSIVVCM